MLQSKPHDMNISFDTADIAMSRVGDECADLSEKSFFFVWMSSIVTAPLYDATPNANRLVGWKRTIVELKLKICFSFHSNEVQNVYCDSCI